MATLASAALAKPRVSHPPDVHAFYYLWYGNEAHDGALRHWNHEVLPHWNEQTAKKFPHGIRYNAPHETHSPFYPQRGCYSSRDAALVEEHLQEAKRAGITTLVLSWWGRASLPHSSDSQGVVTDEVIDSVVQAIEASATGMRFAIHLEPYPGRSAASVREDVQDLLQRFGEHRSWHRIDDRPVFYVYDSYHISPGNWSTVLSADGAASLRGTASDGFFIALWLNADGGRLAKEGGFDGVYTYFASDGFTHGSSSRNWRSMVRWCQEEGLLISISVGPGYNDEFIRPWNARNTKARRDGDYYDGMWRAALDAGASLVSVTSYNEWGEGTQIEPAVPRRVAHEHRRVHLPGDAPDADRVYVDYAPHAPDYYVERTRYWSTKLRQESEL